LLHFRALASGSSGNAFLLQTGKVKLLFEAGLRLPRLRQYLANEGLGPEALSAVLISHEHTDHCLAARDLALYHGVSVWSNAAVLRAAGLHDLEQSCVIAVGSPLRFGDVEVTCFPVSHDAVQPVGFLIQTTERTIVLATDLGQPSQELVEAIAAADLVVLEANHDLRMLQEGRYPYHLRRRVSGPRGHLSNEQAAAILSSRVKSESVEVWLAHLSKENNTPKIALGTVRRALDRTGLISLPVGVASRDRPSLRWNGALRPRQLSLFSASELGAGP
jgi:phosphoribosyl 1,2-cyclic phosphodiesterase